MPMYEYRCYHCGHVQEELASVSGGLRPWNKCNNCGEKKLRRVPSVSNFTVKDGTPKFHGGGK